MSMMQILKSCPQRLGQKIPKGLHVRLNLQTGLKEAKLLDENSEDQTTNAGVHTVVHSAGNLKISALTEVKDQSLKPDEIEKIQEHFKSYKEIKEELGDLVPKTDAEVLTGLMQDLRNLSDVKENSKYQLMAIMEDLEYLAHQYDNALEFARQDGFKDVILRNLNSTDVEILKQTLKLLGALVQNNAKMQIQALENGCLDFVLRILQNHPDIGVKNRAVFALGGIIRRFPHAQLDFMQKGGLSVFLNLFDMHETQLHLRIATLVNDLIEEYNEAVKDIGNPDYVEKIKQYTKVDLLSKLEAEKWCQNLNNLLFGIVIVDRYDHDAIEKILTAILGVVDTCPSSMVSVMTGLEQQYENLEKEENSTDSYFSKLRSLCWNILIKLKKKRTEL